MSAIAAVVFDFYGTLTAGRSSDDQTKARTAQALALGVEPDRFDAELTATVDERFRGAGATVAGSLAWVARRLGADLAPEVLAGAAAVRLATERRFGRPRPEALPALRELRRRGLRIGVLSDCSAELPAYFADLPIAPYVDVTVFSFVTGHRKPEAENYLLVCRELGVAADRCLYVGDGGSNELAGARAVGMRPVHLAVEGEAGSVVYGRHDTWGGETINALAQVVELV